jgi:hypothetical protein
MDVKEVKPNPGYEDRDVNIKKILLWGIGGVVLIVIILAVLPEYFLFVKEDYYFKAVEEPRSKELLELRKRETEELNSYKLLDKEKGIYQIPIERAMELTIEEASK